ncbi:hypothetical protein F4861DRAFT_303990 [Xylaria intraflava]|nr:hypothetical protein F4861DRAFT_303990 [Xylaria intraflava]
MVDNPRSFFLFLRLVMVRFVLPSPFFFLRFTTACLPHRIVYAGSAFIRAGPSRAVCRMQKLTCRRISASHVRKMPACLTTVEGPPARLHSFSPCLRRPGPSTAAASRVRRHAVKESQRRDPCWVHQGYIDNAHHP